MNSVPTCLFKQNGAEGVEVALAKTELALIFISKGTHLWMLLPANDISFENVKCLIWQEYMIHLIDIMRGFS